MPVAFMLAAFFVTAGMNAHAADWEEIPVSEVFIPESGYDDNDDVGIVTDGTLPSACYSVGPIKLEIDSEHRMIRVHQMAIRDRTGYCLDDRHTPMVLKRPVPFTRETSLGLLGSGEYTIEFLKGRSERAQRKFLVAAATSPGVDSLPYALVTGVEQPDYLHAGKEIAPVLTGTLTSSCARLNPEVSIQKQGDIFVILPTQEFVDDPAGCVDTRTPFRLPLKLGDWGPGRYALHIRSMNGRAVNKVIGVFP